MGMSGKYLLDTNIVIALFANEAAVKENLANVEEVFIPSVVIGELFYGAHKSARTKDNLARIDDCIQHYRFGMRYGNRAYLRGGEECPAD